MSHIGFPGLGLSFDISKTAFTIFGINVQWYGIILTTGIIVAFFLFYTRAKNTEKLLEDDILNVTLLTVPIAIIGARITYVITSLDKYDSIWDMFKIWNGGIAIYGAIIFGALTMFTYARAKKINCLKLLDAAAPAVLIGQIIGRWGNFVNAEAYGWSAGVEKLPWRMTVGTVKIDDVVRPDIEFVHPTFLYESLWNLIGFVIIQLCYKKKKKDGQILLMYLMWYGLGRGLLEFLRTDSLRIFGIKLFVVLGLSSFVVCGFLLIRMLKNAKKESTELSEYQTAYCSVDAYDTTLRDLPVEDAASEGVITVENAPNNTDKQNTDECDTDTTTEDSESEKHE